MRSWRWRLEGALGLEVERGLGLRRLEGGLELGRLKGRLGLGLGLPWTAVILDGLSVSSAASGRVGELDVAVDDGSAGGLWLRLLGAAVELDARLVLVHRIHRKARDLVRVCRRNGARQDPFEHVEDAGVDLLERVGVVRLGVLVLESTDAIDGGAEALFGGGLARGRLLRVASAVSGLRNGWLRLLKWVHGKGSFQGSR
jgi:hypothetical protein